MVDATMIDTTNIFNQGTIEVQVLFKGFYEFGIMLAVILILFILGYLIGSFIFSKLVRRILLMDKLQNQLISLGATTKPVWKGIVEFTSQYTLWLTVSFALTASVGLVPIFDIFFTYVMIPLTILISLVICGFLVGGILGKLTKDVLLTTGFEESLKKYNLGESFAGSQLSSILAGIVKWYAFILFVAEATNQVLSEAIITETLKKILNYVPNAILGVFVIIASVILADFVANRIKKTKTYLSGLLSTGIEVIIVFFGIIFALPRLFGITDPGVFEVSLQVMTQSFQILMVGLSLGIAIALGFGLKDSMPQLIEKLGK